MRDKNIKRAAHALFLSQGDDKNSALAKRISDKKARKLVKDQGRALIIIEKLLLPFGKDDYSEEEIYDIITKKLTKKGHRIQDDEAEDTPQYAEEKRKYEEARAARVPNLFDKVEEDTDEEVKPEPVTYRFHKVKEKCKGTFEIEGEDLPITCPGCGKEKVGIKVPKPVEIAEYPAMTKESLPKVPLKLPDFDFDKKIQEAEERAKNKKPWRFWL